VQASISDIKALVPIYAILPPFSGHGGQIQGRLNGSERRKDGVVFIGHEPNRVKGLYHSSGRIDRTALGIGSLIDIRV